MISRFKGKDFLSTEDFSREELNIILEEAEKLKVMLVKKEKHAWLKGKTLAMLFEYPSTRTRTSFETAMTQLGGHAIYLTFQATHLAGGEPLKDFARCLARYCNVITARVRDYGTILELARYAQVPVINAECYTGPALHPCQIMADMLTIKEKKGKLEGLKLVYTGTPTSICNSLMHTCPKMGMNLTIALPEGINPDKDILDEARKVAKESNTEILLSRDLLSAVKDADVIYPTVHIGLLEEQVMTASEKQKRLMVFKPFQVTEEVLTHAKRGITILHCMPRTGQGYEVTDAVFEGPHSVVFDQAENRLHVQKAILALLLM